MFNEVISDTCRCNRMFSENVREGNFAKSFPEEVLNRLEDEENHLQESYEEARRKMLQIDAITEELRAMV